MIIKKSSGQKCLFAAFDYHHGRHWVAELVDAHDINKFFTESAEEHFLDIAPGLGQRRKICAALNSQDIEIGEIVDRVTDSCRKTVELNI